MPYQTVWVEPEVLHRGEHVTVLAAYDEHECDDPLFYWVRPRPGLQPADPFIHPQGLSPRKGRKPLRCLIEGAFR